MTKKTKNIIILGLIMILTATIFTGCGQKNMDNVKAEENQGTLEKIKASGKIILGTSADYPPYEFHMEVNGKDKIVGFDIAIAEEIAKDLGVELEIKDMEFGGLLADLKTNKVDFVLAGMTPDAERMLEVDFSTIYYNAEHTLIINKKDIDKYAGVNDFKGKLIGVQRGAIQEDIAKEQIETPQIKALGKVTNLMLELKTGKVDAVLVEEPVGAAYVRKNDELYMTNIVFKDEDGGSAVAVNKGNEELLEAINKTIERLINENKIDQFVIEANDMMDNE
ncbi:amino acid ABC transporter substrate-binding protein, PAAT family [Proteiniborus ethanoligenes]|uniref:Amino acid ABC transporter substrate-binding protein, PAAT family n=1 Tax=Proteiniborus ethanoligenes TaxID=415015 RepID=A0A1H3PYP6_9FIRM|nr:transporter substrate-binding domain-containing protein [Proteiniborus ethanoligenes]TAH63949.1 MAG: transporter substrate-binding domain-containing protein [Gottschalkiaceae bacterium]SDZ06071.1 amino acid ABC transporter substrate-binding protein, PAAT family [Proteiniborus ethanoligenes]